MTPAEFSSLFSRDLRKLKQEISAYTDPGHIWTRKAQIPNSAGNLCLHLCGNLQTYVGAILGNTGYVRNREAEFSTSSIALEELLAGIDTTINAVEQTFSTLSPERLQEDYPQKIWDKPETVSYTLTQLLAHLNYHLGQINYHRRLID